jgi:hypothetical protein
MAPGVLYGFDSIFGRESSHGQSQLPIARRLNGSPINPLYVLGVTTTATVYLYDKLDVFHGFLPQAIADKTKREAR